MSQLIRSILIARPRFGSIFGWLLRGYFFRPLSVKTVVFDILIVFICILKTANRTSLSHFRVFLCSHVTIRNRVSLAGRSILGIFSRSVVLGICVIIVLLCFADISIAKIRVHVAKSLFFTWKSYLFVSKSRIFRFRSKNAQNRSFL